MPVRMIIDGTSVYDVLEQMDEFPGGDPSGGPGGYGNGDPGDECTCASCGFHFVNQGASGPANNVGGPGWDFDIGQPVEIIVTGETGIVAKRTESLNAPDEYYIEYDKASGGTGRDWFRATALNYATIN
jgi:hypothetical protein